MNRLRIILGHPSILPMLVAFCAGVIILLWLGPVWVWAFAVLGIPIQLTNEYTLHRFVFHLPPPTQQWKFDLLYQAHYGHHDFPTNRKLFFVPAWISLPLLIVDFILIWVILSLTVPAHALSITSAIVLVGGIGTFLGYEWFHMTAHLPVRKTLVERHVTTRHNQHHFRDFSKWFNVTPGGEIIDRALGTAIDRDILRRQQRIEFIRTLGMRPDDPRLISARARFAAKYAITDQDQHQAARVV